MDEYVHACIDVWIEINMCGMTRQKKSSFFLLVWNDTKQMIQNAMGETKKFT